MVLPRWATASRKVVSFAPSPFVVPDDLDLGTVNVVQHRTEIAHVEPLIAAWTFHVMVGFGLSEAIGVDTIVAGQRWPRLPHRLFRTVIDVHHRCSRSPLSLRWARCRVERTFS
jgi:hypothetical protein